MTLPRVLFGLVLANTLGGVLSCGGGGGGPPPPCSWQTCRHEWRNDWGPGISTGHCVYQHRNAHHIYDTHQGSGSCPASSSCSPSTQHRTMCKYNRGSVPLEHGVDVINNYRSQAQKPFLLEVGEVLTRIVVCSDIDQQRIGMVRFKWKNVLWESDISVKGNVIALRKDDVIVS